MYWVAMLATSAFPSPCLATRYGDSRIPRPCITLLLLLLVGRDWVHLVLRPLLVYLYQPQVIDDGDCGAIGGMKIGTGNRSTWRKPPPVPLCPPQIPHEQTQAGTWVAVVGSQWQTAWAMAWPYVAYLLKARTVEPEKQPLPGNGCVTRNSGVTVWSGVFCAVHAEAI
jgi:hypothetical protein